jgi:tetratricopeptide (TPR) repeat protein
MRIPTFRVLEKLDEILRKNDFDSAKRHLTYWLEEAKMLGDNDGKLLVLNELMGLSRKVGDGEQAISYVQKALSLIEELNLTSNVVAGTTFLNSATVYKAFNEPQKSIELFEKAKTNYEQNLSPNDERLGGLYNNMALTLVDLKEFDKAYEFYRKAIFVMQENLDKQPEQAITLLNIASAKESQLGLELAKKEIDQLLIKAKDLLEQCKDRNDGNYAYTCEKCATVFGYYGDLEYQKILENRSRSINERA